MVTLGYSILTEVSLIVMSMKIVSRVYFSGINPGVDIYSKKGRKLIVKGRYAPLYYL